MMLSDRRLAVCFVVLIVQCMSATSERTISSERENVVNAARCSLRCLSLLQPRPSLWQAVPRYRSGHSKSLAQCLDHDNCTACLRPCSQPFVGVSACQTVCQTNSVACTSSCQFLQQVHTTRAGDCPTDDALGQRHCERDCSLDTECPEDMKCCASPCGFSCAAPLDKYKGLAAVPSGVSVRERESGGLVDVTWRAVQTNLTGTVLYVIEGRWMVGQQYREDRATGWRQIAQTTDSDETLRDVTPGHWYRVRVSAVTLSGSRGHSTQTDPFRLRREPRPPGPPRNVTEGDTLIHTDQISVTIHWLPPKSSDLPISRYKLFWSPNHRNRHTGKMAAAAAGLSEMRKVLKADILEYELPNLLYDTNYLVQIQAICKYGDRKLKSTRRNMYFTTCQQAQLNNDQPVPSPVVITPPPPTPAPLTALSVHEAFFQNGLLKVNVSWEKSAKVESSEAEVSKVSVHWTPDVCIAGNKLDDTLTRTSSSSTQESSFLLYDLYFDCRYTVTVWPVGETDDVIGPASSLTFMLPSCSEVKVKGEVEPDCPTIMPQVPVRPPQFQYSFRQLSDDIIVVHLSWHTPASDTPITGYRLIWQPLEGDTGPQSTALTKVLSRGVHSWSIVDLRSFQEYSIQLQALSLLGASRGTELNFTTPNLHNDNQYRFAKGVDAMSGAASMSDAMSEAEIINEKSLQMSAAPRPISGCHTLTAATLYSLYLLIHS